MRSTGVVTAALVGALFAVACGGGDDEPTEVAGVSCEPARSAPEGVTEYEFVFNDLQMPYFVAVPAGYDGSAMAQLQVLLPGGPGTAAPAAVGWGPALLEAEAIVAIPDIVGARRDVEAIQELIGALVEDYCVDSHRVGLIGSSSSGRFTATLAESSDDIVAAMAIGIGQFPPADGAERAVPLLAWTGDSDRSAVDSSVQSWAEVNGCDLMPQEQIGRTDLRQRSPPR